ncbi:MAG: serine/threonine-protein kinase [Planctomycetota bacterium]|nr:serine/threonine-protein kinase [Planctomycetota bacterium]
MATSGAQSEGLFGQIIVARHLATPADVRLCLEIQAKETGPGKPRRTLGEIMVERGFITAAQARLVLEEQQRRQGPKKFGPYEMLCKLGEGGMSSVYKARVQATGIEVALKVMPRKYTDDRMFVARFEREARLGMSLEHSNIVRTVDFGEVNGIHYIALEYVNGGSLDKLLKARNILTEREALDVCAAVARALQYAGEKGLIHRDVKPSNIMLSSAGEVKLSDFGLVKHTDAEASKLTQSGLLVGTPHYISPEQARGDTDIDVRADIYSLGATLYHLVTGQTPFTGSSPLVIITKHLKDELTPPDEINPGLSEGCVAIIEKMMAKDRRDRYDTPEAMLEDIERVRNGEEPQRAGIEVGKSSVRISAKRSERSRGGATGRQGRPRAGDVPVLPTAGVAPGRNIVPGAELQTPRGRHRSGVVDAVPVPGRATPAAGEQLRQRRKTTGPLTPVTTKPEEEEQEQVPVAAERPGRKTPWGPTLAMAGAVAVFAGILALCLWPDRQAAGPAPKPPDGAASKPAEGEAIAQYRRGFREKTPAAGWRYMCNIMGPIRSAGDYQDLVWNEKARGYCASAQAYPGGSEQSPVCLNASGGHPGPGTKQGAATDRYAIAAYKVEAGKGGPLAVRGTLRRNAAGGKVELCVYVNERLKDDLQTAGGNAPLDFNIPLGVLSGGETIYVCVGPDGDSSEDAFDLDFSICAIR